ncbi:SCP2 sterol-binding domain-containing protein, partial [Candidatus Bathyarchaeota archaeon]|nr:SCP2 sterol-binding domain-containing protein [Candidatus Bathyarchaeota archaeon]
DFSDLGLSYVLKVEDGRLADLRSGGEESPDIRITIPSDVFLNVLEKKTNPIKEYSLGRIKIKGSMSDLMRMRKLLF